MYRITNLFLLTIITLFVVACGGEDTSNDGDGDNDGHLNITIENDDGEKSNINIDLNDIKDIDLSDDTEASIEAGIEDLIKAVKGAINDDDDEDDSEDVEAMNFRDIKAIIPSRLLGMERISHSGEKNGAMGISVSQANAKFKDGEKTLMIDIIDSADMGLAKLGSMAWSALDIDKESDDGYERTLEIEGYKAFEKYNSKTGRSELSWMYKKRYIISFKGYLLDSGDLEKARKRN